MSARPPLRRAQLDQTPLHAAAWADSRPTALALLRAPRGPANVNAVDSRKATPLLLAVQRGHFELAAELLDAGAFVNVNYGARGFGAWNRSYHLQIIFLACRVHTRQPRKRK